MKKWIKIHIAAWLCLVALVPALVIEVIMDAEAGTALLTFLTLLLAWFVLLIASFVSLYNDHPKVIAKRELKAQKKCEKLEKAREDLRKKKEWNERCKRREEECKQQPRPRNIPDWPVSAVIVTTQDKTKNKSGLGSAIVGGMIAGPVGAVVGASVGKKTVVTGQKVTFSVKYRSGRTDIETVEVGTERFKTLSSLLLQ